MKFQTAVLTILLGIAFMVFPLGLYGTNGGHDVGELIFALISVIGLVIVLVGFIGGIIGNLKKNKPSPKNEDNESRN